MTALANIQALLQHLDAIWYLIDTEDENKQPCVARYDVRPLIFEHIDQMPLAEIEDLICDHAHSIEVESYHYGSDLNDMYEQAKKESIKGQHLISDAFLYSTNGALEGPVFTLLTQQIATSLGIKIEHIDEQYWAEAYQDNLSPLQAAMNIIR